MRPSNRAHHPVSIGTVSLQRLQRARSSLRMLAQKVQDVSLIKPTADSGKPQPVYLVEIRDRVRGKSQKQLIYRKWQ
ncbi:MAG TPA: hypothetical protein VN946_13225 [Terriglobales bacterium]|jgi:hypothetical protein|nr:hypothetical protein [Terriglobales bacterium]